MKPVYSAPHLFMVHHYKHLLSLQGIESIIKNEFLSGGAGELPPTECWPVLCVAEEYLEKAQTIITQALKDEQRNTTPWVCPQCGEHIEPQFEWCWNCGYADDPRPSSQD